MPRHVSNFILGVATTTLDPPFFQVLAIAGEYIDLPQSDLLKLFMLWLMVLWL